MKRIRFVGGRFILFGLAVASIMSLAVFGLWNALMPAILGLHAITFWQALGLLALTRILFGGWPGGRPGMRQARFTRGGWKSLSLEDQQRFRQAMGNTCGPNRPNTESLV